MARSSRIPYISDEVTQAGVIKPRSAHVVLLVLIPAENHQLLRAILPQHDLDKFFPERARTTRNQDDLFRPIHQEGLTEIEPHQFLRVFWRREYDLEGRRSGLEAVTASISESPRLGRAGRIERERGGRKFCL